MKTKLHLPLLALCLILASSCATQISFPVSNITPGADVSAKVKKDGNDNFTIDLKAENLTSPDRLNPPKNMYVVWIETESGTKNFGKLNMSSGMFSSTNKGSLRGTTAHKPSKIFITAEDTATINDPGTYVIITSEEF